MFEWLILTHLRRWETWMCLPSLLSSLLLIVQQLTSGTFAEVSGLRRFSVRAHPTAGQLRSKAGPLLAGRCASAPRMPMWPCCGYQHFHGAFSKASSSLGHQGHSLNLLKETSAKLCLSPCGTGLLSKRKHFKRPCVAGVGDKPRQVGSFSSLLGHSWICSY